jgi:hypothetical protein
MLNDVERLVENPQLIDEFGADGQVCQRLRSLADM